MPVDAPVPPEQPDSSVLFEPAFDDPLRSLSAVEVTGLLRISRHGKVVRQNRF
jgi:hypothetical protein